MKIAIDPGHNVRNDGGAFGVRSENSLIMDVSTRVIAQLNALGHSVVNCLPTTASSVGHSLRQRVAIANNENADLFASIHFNAFNGRAFGTEVFATSPKGLEIAGRVVNKISDLGYYNRGVKKGNFYVLRNTNMPAILIEGCFCDSRKDMALFNPQDMAVSIVEGLLNQSIQISGLGNIDTEMSGILTISQDTYLKPSTDQIADMNTMEKRQLVKISPGQYAIELITEEEGHYYLDFVNRPGDDNNFFVAMSHSKLKLD